MTHIFDVAFSFAGENRGFVEDVKNDLRKGGYNVFYDNDYKSELWGSDLTIELPKKYYESQFVVLFLDDNYLNKMWTFFERQIIIEKYLRDRGADYILPVLLNDFNKPIPGISGLIGHLKINVPQDKDLLVDMIIRKLKH
jgi:hypothetical protein